MSGARAVRRNSNRIMPLSEHRRRLAVEARLVAAGHTGTTAGTQLLELRLEGDLGHIVLGRSNAAELRKALDVFEAFADADDDKPDSPFVRVERLVF
ncbi:hypothetical protein [Devosia sp. 2618]|uniref:hypothetical protein n=1 Tax=Devosia sp. 2618 TaxID=3156454 RepID=UPI0033970C7E